MKKLIILDIDRTIIDGTSWYRACAFPGLLIEKDLINDFEKINNRFYSEEDSEGRNIFYKKTFAILKKQISYESLSILNLLDIAGKYRIGSYVNGEFLECIGSYTLNHLVNVDYFCHKTISLIYRFYTGDIKIIFLTRGFIPFMRGVVKTYIDTFEEKIEWELVGSTVEIENGKVTLLDEFDQKEKYNYVKKLIECGHPPVFLADDSNGDKRLFDIVNANGGIAFNVKYDLETNKSNWEKLYNSFTAWDNVEGYLRKFCTRESQLNLNHNLYFSNYQCNKIGVIILEKWEFQKIYNSIKDDFLQRCFKILIHQKNDKYYMRGKLYYFWLPPYISVTHHNKYDEWKLLFDTCNHMIQYIAMNKKYNKAVHSLVLYTICDHLVSALYLAIYYLEEASLDGVMIDKENYRQISKALDISNLIIFGIIHEKTIENYWCDLASVLKKINIDKLSIIENGQKYSLEIDNHLQIFATVEKIVANMGEKLNSIENILYFSYGAISFAYAFKAVLKDLYNRNINIVPSHFSSKRYMNKEFIIKRIPDIFDFEIETLDEILVLDNNVTTFSTMKMAKELFLENGKRAICCVESIDYHNLVSWVLDIGNYEIPCVKWFEVLDYYPQNNYVRAYNTWRTGDKNKILEEIYSDSVFDVEIMYKKRAICARQRKICRVQNLYDLQMAIEMGATMIGIHAVITNKERYYETEAFVGNKERKYADLPVPDYEVEGIRNMVFQLPKNILPVLVIESPLSINAIKRILVLYGLDSYKAGIQLQFSASKEYLEEIAKMDFSTVIIAVGLTQVDIIKYMQLFDGLLRTECDYLLLDMSKHQPNLIHSEAEQSIMDKDQMSKYSMLEALSGYLKELRVSILLADDINPEEFVLYQLLLGTHGINIAGLDMQNNIEVNKYEQGYCKLKNTYNNNYHYAKIRKSIDQVQKWDVFDPIYVG
ncbi:hypothetical protein SAMN04487831_11637 [Pseudobutyrivibrio sp. UC1225]|uniref:hypothetical protein n=1 Tax=Pseudobutyrivibrio sp. UC1225 TaxID=1798185 RepID=UPI0008E8B8AF|nr:hypothetical protein [Pseudobutyrivibrio sp. UC1225]SFO28720.1 hypothetical protein SAMN04487831_11637 [Pseudobutyrivibrio sp. UC1225]